MSTTKQRSMPPTRSRGRGGSNNTRGKIPPGRGLGHNAPPKRRMELIASVSRSSGLERDGDTLKDYKVQEEYREFIQEKLNDVFTHHPWHSTSGSESEATQRRENVLILLRKLREGVSSSNRKDTFAFEVYETSLFLAALFNLPRHLNSIIPQFVPDFYSNSTEPNLTGDRCHLSIIVSLLHHLIAAYPSQSIYHQYLDSIPKALFPMNSPSRKWIKSLSSYLRTGNYTKFEYFSQRPQVLEVFGGGDLSPNITVPISMSEEGNADLGKRSVLVLVDSLRNKVRETSWSVIRSAYRELSCNSNQDDTKSWLVRSLCLKSAVVDDFDTDPEQWLAEQVPLGHVRRKDGVEGRWVVCKVR